MRQRPQWTACVLVAITLLCSHLSAQKKLEPLDEYWLETYRNASIEYVTGLHEDLKRGYYAEAAVLDRGKIRTVQWQVLISDDGKSLIEVHNGRGLVWAFEVSDASSVSRLWVGRAGEAPQLSTGKVPLETADMVGLVDLGGCIDPELFESVFDEQILNAPYRAGTVPVPATTGTMWLRNLTYQITWAREPQTFCNRLLVQVEGLELFRVTRTEWLDTVKPVLDWSKTFPDLPGPTPVAAWETPPEDWYIENLSSDLIMVIPWRTSVNLSYGFPRAYHPPGLAVEGDYHNPASNGWFPFGFVSGNNVIAPPTTMIPGQSDDVTAAKSFAMLMKHKERLIYETVRLVGPWAKGEYLQELAGYEYMGELELALQTIAPAALKTLSTFDALCELHLVGPSSPELLNALGTMSLEGLAWDSGAPLERLPASVLQMASLAELTISSSSIAGIGALTGLSSLSLRDADLATAKAEDLAALGLSMLHLQRCKLAPPFLSALANLDYLELESCTGLDSSMSAIGSIPSLTGLTLIGPVTLPETAWEKGFAGPELKELHLIGKVSVSRAGWKCLLGTPKIAGLRFTNVASTEWCSGLADTRRPIQLLLEGDTWVDWDLLGENKLVEELALTRLHCLTGPSDESEMKLLSKLRHVRTLSVSGIQSEVRELKKVEWQSLKSLRELSLSIDTADLRLADLLPELAKLPALEVLAFYKGVGLAEAIELAKFPALKLLHGWVTPEAKRYLAKQRPDIQTR